MMTLLADRRRVGRGERMTEDMRISVDEAIDILSRMSQNHFYGHRETEAMRMGAEALWKRDEVE